MGIRSLYVYDKLFQAGKKTAAFNFSGVPNKKIHFYIIVSEYIYLRNQKRSFQVTKESKRNISKLTDNIWPEIQEVIWLRK